MEVVVKDGTVKFRGVAKESLEIVLVSRGRVGIVHKKNSWQIIGTQDAVLYELPAENNRRKTCE